MVNTMSDKKKRIKLKPEEFLSESDKITEGVVVGSSIIKLIENNLGKKSEILNNVSKFIKDLKGGTNL